MNDLPERKVSQRSDDAMQRESMVAALYVEKGGGDVSTGDAKVYCSACPTALTGGECPRCGTYWTRNEDGKNIGLRPGSLGGVFRGQIIEPKGAPPSIDPLLAEAYCALNSLWMNLVYGGKLLSDQQAEALRYVGVLPRREWSSRELADALHVSHQAAANVLTVLVDKGLLRRDREGRRVTYSLAHLWPTGELMRSASFWRAKKRAEEAQSAAA